MTYDPRTVGIHIDRELHRAIRLRAVQEGMTIRRWIEAAARKALEDDALRLHTTSKK
jgi:predicted HicB family RNase H-like nuclease